MTEELTISGPGKKTAPAEAKKADFAAVISEHKQILANVYKRGKVPLTDDRQVSAQTLEFFSMCEDAGSLPTFEKYAAYLGYSRQYLYAWLSENSETVAAEIIDQARTIITSIMIDEGLKRNTSEVLTIFMLKNAVGQNFLDRTQVENVNLSSDRSLNEEDLLRRANTLPDYDEQTLTMFD